VSPDSLVGAAAGRAWPPPVAVALDTGDLPTALAWAEAVGPYVSTVKVGLELYLRHGASAVREIRAVGGHAVFLDLKLHDIPNTVAGAARSLAVLEPAYLTVHACGGAAMVRAAVQAVPGTLVTAVTVLTSLDGADLARAGFAGSPRDTVLRLATLAVQAGAGALVCSPQEVAAVRAEVGPDIVLVTPGVRPSPPPSATHQPGERSPWDDQARVATARQAIADGADLLVVGRPLTAAADPAAAAAALAASLPPAAVRQ
jgi:orotidine-5'-phosphate decarboxylase